MEKPQSGQPKSVGWHDEDIRVYVCVSVHTLVYIYVCVCVSVHIYIGVCVSLHIYIYVYMCVLTSLVVQWSESLTTNHEVPGSIPGPTVGIFLEWEDSRGDHGLGRLVEFRFKAPPGTTSSSITTRTPSGQRNCASWASQPQKSVTLLPCPGRRTTRSTKDMWWHWTKKRTNSRVYMCLCVRTRNQ